MYIASHNISVTSIISGGTLVLGDKQRLTPSSQNAATLVSRWKQNREISIYNDYLRCSQDPQQYIGFGSTRCYQKYQENQYLTPQNQGKSSRCAKTCSAMLSRVTAAPPGPLPTLVRWPPVKLGSKRDPYGQHTLSKRPHNTSFINFQFHQLQFQHWNWNWVTIPIPQLNCPQPWIALYFFILSHFLMFLIRRYICAKSWKCGWKCSHSLWVIFVKIRCLGGCSKPHNQPRLSRHDYARVSPKTTLLQVSVDSISRV